MEYMHCSITANASWDDLSEIWGETNVYMKLPWVCRCLKINLDLNVFNKEHYWMWTSQVVVCIRSVCAPLWSLLPVCEHRLQEARETGGAPPRHHLCSPGSPLTITRGSKRYWTPPNNGQAWIYSTCSTHTVYTAEHLTVVMGIKALLRETHVSAPSVLHYPAHHHHHHHRVLSSHLDLCTAACF